MATKVKLDLELQDSLKDIIKSCRDEDKEIRKAMVRLWQKNEEFWHGVQYLFWSKVDERWRSPADLDWEDGLDEDTQELGSFSDKVINIFRAHGEAIIAALAAKLPALRFLPDDADNTDDVVTARTYSKIGDLVQRHNKAKFLTFRALFFLTLQGMVASYRYKESDPSYGVYKIPKYGVEEKEVVTFECPDCGAKAETNWVASGDPCYECGSVEPPNGVVSLEKVPVLAGMVDQPKTRAKMDLFGPMHFKVPYYARNQKECTYFGIFLDQGKDVACSNFPDLVEEIQAEGLEDYDRFARSIFTYPSHADTEAKTIVTVEKWWLRPEAFYRETDKSKRDRLLAKYPRGARVILIGKNCHFADVLEESMDDRIVIGQAGLSTYIHSDPVLQPLVQIQEMRNQLVNLAIETIEHGIPSEFVDPATLNTDTYGKFEALPGFIYQAKPGRPGDPLGNSFYTSARATLSKEVVLLLRQLDQDAQFTIGSFPSIYGGPSEGKSRTFAEYAASRQMALQRLSILWSFFVDWWTDSVRGLVDMYAESVIEDERYTQFENGSYVNVWIKRANLQGKIGGCEAEASETFPISLAQKKDLILKLMEMNNEFVNNALYQPENARVIQDVLALTEFKLPGEAQRVKQHIEIIELLKGQPVPTGEADMSGQEVIQSSLPIDPDVDDHAVHIAVLRSYLVELPGLDLLRENPIAYENVKAHLKAHQQALAMQTMQNMGGNTPAGEEPETAKAGVE